MSVHDENLASSSELKVQSSPYRPYGLKIKRNLGYISDEMNIFAPESIQAQIELEQIADDYAVEFLNWYIRKSSIMDKKYIGITSEELLEIFKKEKETNSNKVV